MLLVGGELPRWSDELRRGRRSAEEVGLDLAHQPAAELDVAAAGALAGLGRGVAVEPGGDVLGDDAAAASAKTPASAIGSAARISDRVDAREGVARFARFDGTQPSAASPQLDHSGHAVDGDPDEAVVGYVPPPASRACPSPMFVTSRLGTYSISARAERIEKGLRELLREGTGAAIGPIASISTASLLPRSRK